MNRLKTPDLGFSHLPICTTTVRQEKVGIVSRENIPQAPEPVVMPQVVHTKGGELHDRSNAWS